MLIKLESTHINFVRHLIKDSIFKIHTKLIGKKFSPGFEPAIQRERAFFIRFDLIQNEEQLKAPNDALCEQHK